MTNKTQETETMICQLCGSVADLTVYQVPPYDFGNNPVVACRQCRAQIEGAEAIDSNHWNFLSGTIWSDTPAVQVISWRMLNRLKAESWAADILDMAYLAEDIQQWAEASSDAPIETDEVLHKDVNGNTLQHGDTVVLTKSLDVKGSSLNLKMGTVIKNIKLVEGNEDQIEAKVTGQQLVILTKFVRKQI